MTVNNLLPPGPQQASYEYGGNPGQNAAGRAMASNNAQINRNQALMGGKIKRRSSKNKKRRSSKNKKRKSLKKKRSSKKRFNKRGGANNFQVKIVPASYPSASGESQNTTATQLQNAGAFAQSQLYSSNDKYATIK